MPASKPVTLFFCYAPEDEPLRKELEKHLTLLERQGSISSWSGRSIGAGADWRAEVERRMAEAGVILLLVSADFLASDQLYEVELKRAMARRSRGAHVLGVLLRPTDWDHGDLHDEALPLEMLPAAEAGRGVVPVTEWPSRDAAFKSVAEALRAKLKVWSLTSRISMNPMGSPPPRVSQIEAQRLPAVWNVPLPRNLNFTGRADDLDRLRQGFTRRMPKSSIQAVYGLGGMGKTQLALEYAYRFATEYDVVWWIRAEEPATLAADLADLAVELQLPGRVEPEQRAAIEAVKQWLERKDRWLLVFDSARDPLEVTANLPLSVRGHVLVTSRWQTWQTPVLGMRLRSLKPSEAVELLLVPGGAGSGQEAAARELAAELDNLPLALAQAGAYMEEAGISVAEYLVRFRGHRAELMKRGAQGDAPTVATTWSMAFRDAQERSPAAGELLGLCSFLAADDIPRNALALGFDEFPPALAAAVSDPFAFDEAIKALRRYSLIDVHDDALSVHRLVQAAARDRLDEGERRAWAERAVAFVCAVFPKEPSDPAQRGAGRRWLPHARAALLNARAAAVPPGEPAERLLRHAAHYQATFGFDGPAREMFDEALAIAEAIHGPDHAHVAMALTSLGMLLMRNGELDGALQAARRALQIDEANLGRDSFIVATDAINLASVLKERNALAEARRLAERALAIDEALGPTNAAAVARDANNLGVILREQDDLAGARRCFERAIAIDEQRRPDDLALHLNNLSLLLREMHELDEAQRLAERALAIGEERYGRDDPNVATFHSNLASVLQELGTAPAILRERRDALLGEARAHLERALEIGEHIYGGDHYVVAIRRNNLGLLLMDLGDLPGALGELQRAVEIARKALGPEHRRVKKLENNRDVIRRHLAGLTPRPVSPVTAPIAVTPKLPKPPKPPR